MAENLDKWPSKRGPISKIRPSDDCGRDAVPLAMERRYDFPEFGGYLGNVGSHHQISPIKGQIVIYRSSLERIRLKIPFVLRFPTTSGGRLENLG